MNIVKFGMNYLSNCPYWIIKPSAHRLPLPFLIIYPSSLSPKPFFSTFYCSSEWIESGYIMPNIIVTRHCKFRNVKIKHIFIFTFNLFSLTGGTDMQTIIRWWEICCVWKIHCKAEERQQDRKQKKMLYFDLGNHVYAM